MPTDTTYPSFCKEVDKTLNCFITNYLLLGPKDPTLARKDNFSE